MPAGYVSLPQATTIHQSASSLQQPLTIGGCIYPGCTKSVYVEQDGKAHQFCSRTHAAMYHTTSTATGELV